MHHTGKPALRAAGSGLLLAASMALLLAGCHGKPAPPAAAAAEKKANAAQWSEQIAGHTAGLVPRRSTISLRFSHPVTPGNDDPTKLAKLLSIAPAVEGEATLAGGQELVFKPAKPLTPGTEYVVKLDPKALPELPQTLAPYEFRFRVLEPNYELKTAGLEAAADGGPTMKLTGTLETADGEDAAAVEKILHVRVGNTDQKLEWLHYNENRTHDFSVAGIARAADTGHVQLLWDGTPIGVKTSGERSIDIPKLGLFEVSEAVVAKEDKQLVRVRFSELLDASQNLSGLVKLGKTKITTRVDGNALLVYPADPVVGEAKLRIEPGVKSAKGVKLKTAYDATLQFVSEKPQVRFVGQGVILPQNPTLAIPFEAINVSSVQVTAFQVYDDAIGQFLQTNKLGGDKELHRVGRYLWRKTLRLTGATADAWTRYTLDATELLKAHPGSLLRLTLSLNRGNSLYSCKPDPDAPAPQPEEPFKNYEDIDLSQASGWDFADDYYGEESGERSGDWADREDPCKDAYYRYSKDVKAERNFLASDIGLLAKRGNNGKLSVVATHIHDATPFSGAHVEIHNFQDQPIGKGDTNGDGIAELDPNGTPFYLIAKSGGEIGYLKLSRGSALPVSHFDVGGETVTAGLKGFLYGERGVWRPGDAIHLSLILEDKDKRLPEGHPVTVQLVDPKGHVAQTAVQTKPVGDFYVFTLKTADDAPTGTWTAKALVGGAEFTKALKIETVMPNRLKMDLDFAKSPLTVDAMPATATLSSQWLTGASAAGLKADLAVKLNPVPTHFTRFADFAFDDPTREFKSDRNTIFEGKLDASGKATIPVNLEPASPPPGQLEAAFTARVFEDGGAFSINQSSQPFHPYAHYVGIKTEKGDPTRGMLLTDIDHPLEIATVDARGEPVAIKVKAALYKISWKWWWEKSENSGEFSQNTEQSLISEGTVQSKAGRAVWNFKLKYPDWGRYLLRACDVGDDESSGGHCASKVVYIDWPGWAGRAQEENGPGASALQFSTDKTDYTVGETAHLQLPDATQGRALFTVENGSKVLSAKWVVFEAGKPAKIDLPITAAMSPNVYAAITLMQPHQGKNNDRPIRLYGIVPIKVKDPATVLTPVIKSDDLWRPSSDVKIDVSESGKHAMTYTLAVVDEGLLGLTNYKAPNPRDAFYQREALGVTTWDLFDDVTGAYGASLERLLALGGDTGGPLTEKKEQKRFPPVVQFLGPFHLDAGQTGQHVIKLPQYIGAVRIMVVAGDSGAYGVAEKSVTVRDPLSVLPTLPRVLGPEETLRVPVSAFAFEPDIREVQLTAESTGPLSLTSKATTLNFAQPGEKIGFFDATVGSGIGKAGLTVKAQAGKYKTQGSIAIDVRPQNPVVAQVLRKTLQPGEEWKPDVVLGGVAGTTSASLEVAAVPPFDLDRRLQYLIQYPHGCVEQTTSSVFPQLYLDSLIVLTPEQKKQVEKNINAGIERLRLFQVTGGGFTYWPGGGWGGGGVVDPWASNYAGHFLAEAKRLGYHVPTDMFDVWVGAQRTAAGSWTAGSEVSAEIQAYRLYTLALADRPEVAAMNRLREAPNLSAMARWQLALAYARIGLADAAADITRNALDARPAYARPGETYGSELRDRAMLLDLVVALHDDRRTDTLTQEISGALASESWYSTQTTAYSLLALANRYTSTGTSAGSGFGFDVTAGDAKKQSVKVEGKTLWSQSLDKVRKSGDGLVVKNTAQRPLYASVILRGSPPPGHEDAVAEGLKLDVQYLDGKGAALDPTKIAQGTDFTARVTIANSGSGPLTDLALTEVLPSGWEIHNARLDGDAAAQKPEGADYQDIRDDRVNTYFGLKAGESKTFKLTLNASYQGRYYLPAVSVESMYDARRHARTTGQWVEVVRGGDKP